MNKELKNLINKIANQFIGMDYIDYRSEIENSHFPETIKGVKYVPIGYYGKYGTVNNPKTIKENLEHILKYDPLQVLNNKEGV